MTGPQLLVNTGPYSKCIICISLRIIILDIFFRWHLREGDHNILHYLPQWLEEGVNIIGGCCEVTADEIKQMRHIIDEFNAKKND